MQDIAEQLTAWHSAGRSFAVATVVSVTGSAPRGPGAALAVADTGEVVGSLSGGCVEGAVYELCQESLVGGRTSLHSFGYSDDDAFATGLTCGGVIDVLVQPIAPGLPGPPVPSAAAAAAVWGTVLGCIRSGSPVALVRVVGTPAPTAAEPTGHGPAERGPGGADPLLGAAFAVTGDTHHGSLDLPGLPPSGLRAAAPERTAVLQARAMLDAGRTGRFTLTPEGLLCTVATPGSLTFFVESYTPPPRMIVFGAVDFAAAVARIGGFLGYHVTVCDARAVFTTERRFPEADRVVVDWPHRYLDAEAAAGHLDGRTAVCVLTHDPKFDIPLLERALRLPLGFVGAMGSRRTHDERVAELREAGLTDLELARLRSPIGLDLGARTPEETAVAVAAEITAHRRGGTCLPLSTHRGPIHHDRLNTLRTA